MAITAQDVANYLQANPGLSDAQIAAAMDAYGATPQMVAQATGINQQEVQSRYQTASAVKTTPNDIAAIYEQFLGRAPDPEGLAYWSQTLAGSTPQQAAAAIVGAAANVNPTGQGAEVQQAVSNAQAIVRQQQQIAETAQNVASVYQNILGKEPDAEGLKYWSQTLAGQDLGTITSTIANAAAQVQGATPQDVAAAKQASTYVKAQQALQSTKLTQEQYNDLAAYFGNEVLPKDQNQIKDFVGNKSGFEFANYLATRGTQLGGTGDKTAQVQQLQKLVLPLTSQEIQVTQRSVDNETGEQGYFAVNPITGQEERLVDTGNGMLGFQYGQLGRANDDPGKTGYYPQLMLKVDPNTGTGSIVGADPNMGSAGGGGMLSSLVSIAAPIALNALLPGLGASLGASILGAGASTAAQAALGNALIGGLTTGAITGDLEKGLIAGALAGAGTYAVETGALGDVFDSVGLGDYKDTFGIKNTTQIANIGDVESQLGGFYGNTPTATYNPQTGLTGLADGRVVVDANNVSGLPAGTYTQQEFINQLGQTFPELANTGMLSNASNTNLGSGIKAPTNAGEMLGVGTAGAGVAGGVAGGTGLTPGAAGVTGIGAGAAGAVAGAAGGSTVAQAISDALGNKTLQGLLSTGIDYAKLNELQNLAQEQGAAARQQATEAGKLANIPFTPYTVTTGAGTTAFGTNAAGQPTAAVTASPEYEALRQQAIQASGQALGSIAPGTYSQSLYDRARALAAPTEQRQQEQLLSSLGAKGLLGISRNLPTTGGTTAGVNPYLESLLSSQRTADVNLALQAQQAGTQEAQRQAALAQALQSQAQGVDTQALQTLVQGVGTGQTATQLNQTGALRQLEATLQGQKLGTAYDLTAMDAQSRAIIEAAGAAKGMFGLPTTAGNTPSTNLVQQAVNYLGGIFS